MTTMVMRSLTKRVDDLEVVFAPPDDDGGECGVWIAEVRGWVNGDLPFSELREDLIARLILAWAAETDFVEGLCYCYSFIYGRDGDPSWKLYPAPPFVPLFGMRPENFLTMREIAELKEIARLETEGGNR